METLISLLVHARYLYTTHVDVDAMTKTKRWLALEIASALLGILDAVSIISIPSIIDIACLKAQHERAEIYKGGSKWSNV